MEKNMELNYNTLLLNHLGRISYLSTFLPGQQVGERGNYIHYKETDKISAFTWAVQILDAFIPDELKDKTYRKERDKWEKDWNETLKSSEHFDQQKYNMELLVLCVNLLTRKGYLLQSEGVIDLIKRQDKEEEEVFED